MLFRHRELPPVGLGGKSGLLAEDPKEIIVVGNADLLADFAVGQIGGGQQLHGPLDAQPDELFVDAAAVGPLGEFVQIG